MSDRRLVVGVITRHRTDYVVTCVRALLEQDLPDIQVEIVIVENDTVAASRERLNAVAASAGGKITYLLEPRRGYASARNRVLEYAESVEAELIAFIDDDEVPAGSVWVKTLFAALNNGSASIVYGPVIPVPESVWMSAPQARNRAADGKKRPSEPKLIGNLAPVPTCNVMFRLDGSREFSDRFDEAFNLTGGEDIDFFFRLQKRVGRAKFISDALLLDIKRDGRMKASYRFKSFYAGGHTRYRIYGKSIGPRAALTALGSSVVWSLMVTPAIILGVGNSRARNAVLKAYGRMSGMLAAAIGTAAPPRPHL